MDEMFKAAVEKERNYGNCVEETSKRKQRTEAKKEKRGPAKKELVV